MKNILVTGGSGYIGSVLSKKLLDSGYNVTVYDNFMYRQASLLGLCSFPNFEIVVGDIRDYSLLKQCIAKSDAIIHLACIVGAPACDRDKTTANTVNFDAVTHLCAIKSPSQLLIYPTTNSGYGTQSGEIYCTEETPLEPISLYGKLKTEAEKYILDTENSITLRLATVFGVSPRMRMDLLVNDFVYKAMNDKVLVLFEKHFKRNFVYIHDVVDCFEFCINNANKMIGGAYNLGNDAENLCKEELALRIKKYLPEIEIYESELGQDPDKRNYIVSSEKIAKIGFSADTSIDVGIEELRKAYSMIGSLKLGNV